MSTDFAFIDRSDPRDLIAIERLGPIVVACRGRSPFQTSEPIDLNPQSILYKLNMALRSPLYVFISFIGAIALSSPIMMIGIILSNHGFNELYTIIAWGAAAALGFVCLLIAFFRKPTRSPLVLHEHGFRYRKRLVPLDEAKAIVYGFIPSRYKRLFYSYHRFASRFLPDSSQIIENLERTQAYSLTFYLKNGDFFSAPAIANRVEREVFKAFIEGLNARRSELFDWMRADVSAFDPRIEKRTSESDHDEID